MFSSSNWTIVPSTCMSSIPYLQTIQHCWIVLTFNWSLGNLIEMSRFGVNGPFWTHGGHYWKWKAIHLTFNANFFNLFQTDYVFTWIKNCHQLSLSALSLSSVQLFSFRIQLHKKYSPMSVFLPTDSQPENLELSFYPNKFSHPS